MRNVTRRIAGWFARWPPLAILAAGWVVAVVYAFPGMMTMDSIDQLTEARTGFYTDGHPPAMAALWRIVDTILAGPFGMLVLQTVAFVAGLYLLLRRAMRPRRAAVAASLLLVFPPILAPMAVIWKDCIMAGFLVLGTACLLAGCRWVRVLGLACLWLLPLARDRGPLQHAGGDAAARRAAVPLVRRRDRDLEAVARPLCDRAGCLARDHRARIRDRLGLDRSQDARLALVARACARRSPEPSSSSTTTSTRRSARSTSPGTSSP